MSPTLKKIIFCIIVSIYLLRKPNIFEIIKGKHKNNKSSFRFKNIIKNGKLVIPIGFALDHGYLNPTIVAMTSVCLNANNTTYYELYVLVPENFSKEDSDLVFTVKERNKKSCNVTIVNMGSSYNNAKLGYRIPAPSYYRLSMPSLFPLYDRMIYLDGDIIALSDLTEMYNLDLKDNYVLGNIAYKLTDFQKFNITSTKLYVCAGILLMNLKKMREDYFELKAQNLIKNHKEKLEWHDQTTLNVVGVGKVGLLPAKYGFPNYLNYDSFSYEQLFSKRENIIGHYREKEMYQAYNDPKIIHYANLPKPWKIDFNSGFGHYFWHYAKQTSVYDELIKNYIKELEEKWKKQEEERKKKEEESNKKI